MIPDGPQRGARLRVALAAVVVTDVVSFFFFIGDARAVAPAGALTTVSEVCSRTPVLAAVVSIGIVGAVAFARRPGRLVEGLVCLAALALLSTVHAQLFGSPWRHLYYSGLCLSGWLLGLAMTRRRGAPADESFARMGSIALLGAAYLNAGISKLVYGGVDWLSGLPIQAAVIGQDGMVGDGIVGGYRTWVVGTPAVAALLAVATLGFELAGPLMLVGRRTRLCVALGLLAMHSNIYLLTTHILYWESMAFLLIFGIFADQPGTRPSAISASEPHDRGYVIAATVLASCALLAITHQARRSAQSQQAHRTIPVTSTDVARTGPSVITAAATPKPTRRIGPLVVGETVSDGWVIDALDVTTDGFTAALSGRPGRVTFEVTCGATEHRSPFDLGAAHIFYSIGLESRDLQAVGAGFRERVRGAADGRDVCEEVARWRTSAQMTQAE